VLLALLGMLGPFSIDTYIPAFSGIAAALGATPVQMQQTLSAYLFGFAFMNLFHGALSDSFGRRPVVLWGMAVFTSPRPAARCRRTSASWCSSARCRACRPAPASWCRAR
jgi:MFS family permease